MNEISKIHYLTINLKGSTSTTLQRFKSIVKKKQKGKYVNT